MNIAYQTAIRNALKLGNFNRHELQLMTGLPLSTVVSAVSLLCSKGEAIPLGTRKSRTYAYAEQVKREVAGKREIEWKPLHRDPFIHWKLAMEIRK